LKIDHASREKRAMIPTSSLLAYWWFHIPNFILAALMYTLLGRAILGLIVDANSTNYIWRFFCRVTDPVIAVFGFVTPKATAPVVLWLFCFVWLFWLRFAFFVVLAILGLNPSVGAQQ
jgi:YggT family protein